MLFPFVAIIVICSHVACAMQADLAEANDRESAANQKVSELMHELGLRRTAALLGTSFSL